MNADNANFDARRCALLIVDLQHDFLAPDGAYARGGVVSEAARELPARISGTDTVCVCPA